MSASDDDRRLGIGGSDAAPAIGVESFGRNRVSLWQEKTGRVARPDLSDERRIRRGNFLESWIASEYTLETGRRLRRRNTVVEHPRYPFMRASVDRMVVGERRGVEVKSVHPLASRGWGEPGSDEVPLVYLTQVVHYMACLDVDVWDVAAMFGDDLRVYTITRNIALEEAVIGREADFWRHVVDDTPPEPRTVGEVLDLYPRDSGESVVASAEIAGVHEALMATREQIDALETDRDALSDAIKVFMGERGILTDAHGRALATWKAAASGGTDWKAAALSLLDRLAWRIEEETDVDTVKRQLLAEVERDFAREPSRRFLLKSPRTNK